MRIHGALFAFRLVASASIVVGASTAPVLAEDLGKLLSDNQSISEEVLAGQRGGTAPAPTATVSDNKAFTGINNSVNDVTNSMNGAAGLFNVIQNSGNNVAIQSMIIVNANLQ
jgi:hypothetical protein